ncbi:MAG TPA: hypothetical protein VE998_05090 [Terriglobales bacterium]|nr:hypothetical protein [Terriglobales bacterium]
MPKGERKFEVVPLSAVPRPGPTTPVEKETGKREPYSLAIARDCRLPRSRPSAERQGE